jgi:hypothetical protein
MFILTAKEFAEFAAARMGIYRSKRRELEALSDFEKIMRSL